LLVDPFELKAWSFLEANRPMALFAAIKNEDTQFPFPLYRKIGLFNPTTSS
jgi:hypothetical protein